jgi:branched-chain amino acid transport system substrate-binding protein
MLHKRLIATAATAVLATAGTLASVVGNLAMAQVKVGVVTSSTGPVSLVGIPQKNTVPLLPAKAGDLKIEYISLDDASDPTKSVTEVKKLISEYNVDAIIGPSGSPNAMGVISLRPKPACPCWPRWARRRGAADDGAEEVGLQDHPERRPHRQRAGGADGQDQGQDGGLHHHQRSLRRELGQGLWRTGAKNGIKIVANERYQRTDTSVTAQTLKISRPIRMRCW